MNASPPADFQAVPPLNWDSVCGRCGGDVGRGSYCAGCRLVRYCGAECQRAHWRDHRRVCESFARLRSVYRDEVPRMPVLEAWPDDTTGALALVYPQGDEQKYRFTRRTSTAETRREFVLHGMHLWTRAQWTTYVSEHNEELQAVWRRIFGRGGMTRSGLHLGGSVDGMLVLRLRGLAVNLSKRRYLQVCVMLGALGLGLITGVKVSGRDGVAAWRLHDWRVLIERRYPASVREGIVFVAATPLLPLSMRLYREQGMDLIVGMDGGDSGAEDVV